MTLDLDKLERRLAAAKKKARTEAEFEQRKRLIYFGGEIAGRRKDAGLSQDELAKQVGISRPYLARLELGSEPPSDALLDKLIPKLQWSRSKAHAMLGRPDPPRKQMLSITKAGDIWNKLIKEAESDYDYLLQCLMLRRTLRLKQGKKVHINVDSLTLEVGVMLDFNHISHEALIEMIVQIAAHREVGISEWKRALERIPENHRQRVKAALEAISQKELKEDNNSVVSPPGHISLSAVTPHRGGKRS